jgi:hypothetical protein
MAERLALAEQALKGMDEVAGRIRAAEQAIRPIDDINARLSKVETSVNTPRAAGPDATLTERINGIEAATKSLDQRLSELGRRLEGLQAVLRDESRRPAAAERAEPAPAADGNARRAVLASALDAAVARGDPFAGELGALKPLLSNQAEIAALERFAASGVPSALTLARELSALTPTMLAAVAPVAHDGGVFDRLQASAGRLVRIRPVNEVAGEDPDAVIARLEAKAARQDIDGALSEIAKLPEAARAPAKDWIEKAKARGAALAASRRLSAEAMSALGKPSP